MKLIKKSEKLLLEQIKIMEEAEEQNLSADTTNAQESTVEEEQEPNTEYAEPNYIPLRNHPLVQSVGNTGWQVSEIWKDIRLDHF